MSPNIEFTSSTMPKKRSHFYTNAAPTKIEGNVFRYDFDDKVNTKNIRKKFIFISLKIYDPF